MRGTLGLATRGATPYDHACLFLTSVTSFSDPAPVGSGGWYYVVTASNACGMTAEAFGSSSRGERRQDGACP